VTTRGRNVRVLNGLGRGLGVLTALLFSLGMLGFDAPTLLSAGPGAGVFDQNRASLSRMATLSKRLPKNAPRASSCRFAMHASGSFNREVLAAAARSIPCG